MRKDCHTCKHDLFNKNCFNCITGNPPSNWEASSHYIPDTNAEHIRNMNDEELAEFLNVTLEWLRQPCE